MTSDDRFLEVAPRNPGLRAHGVVRGVERDNALYVAQFTCIESRGGDLAARRTPPNASIAFRTGRLGHTAFLRALEAAGVESAVHGMRSSFRVWCKENGVADDVAAFCLGHVERSKTMAAYRRSTMIEPCAKVMQAWGAALFPADQEEPTMNKTERTRPLAAALAALALAGCAAVPTTTTGTGGEPSGEGQRAQGFPCWNAARPLCTGVWAGVVGGVVAAVVVTALDDDEAEAEECADGYSAYRTADGSLLCRPRFEPW